MNFIKGLLLLLLIFSVFIPPISGQEGNETLRLSIAGAEEYALQNNRAVLTSRLNIDLAVKQIWENLAMGLPQVSVDANFLHQFVVPEISFGQFLNTDLLPDGPVTGTDIRNAFQDTDPIPLGVRNNTTIDLTLTQLIFSGQYFVGLKTSRIVKQVSEKALVKTEDLTRESVAGAYYAILVIRENLRLLRESLTALDNTHSEMEKMFEQGLNEETDVDQINVTRANIRTMISSLEEQEVISLKLLKFQLGIEFNRTVELTDSLPLIIEQGSLMYLTQPEFSLQNSIDYQIVETQERISEMLLKLEQSKYLPTISAFYRHQEQTNRPNFNFAVTDVIGASLNFPIISSGMRSAKVSQAKFELQKARLGTKDAGQGLTMEFETALNNFRTAHSNFIVNRESVDLSKKIYDRTLIKYREGVSSSFELAQNQNQFITAESNYYNSLLSLLNAKARLDRILRTN